MQPDDNVGLVHTDEVQDKHTGPAEPTGVLSISAAEQEQAQEGGPQTVPAIFANYDAILDREVAAEIVNRARGIVQDRIYALEAAGDEEGANRLDAGPGTRLFTVLRSLDYRNQAHSKSVIATWGQLVRNEAALWKELDA